MNENLQAIDAIENFLTDGQSTLEAARCIANIYEPRLKSRQRYDAGILWAEISEAARSIDGSAPAQLAELVVALRDRPDVVSNTGQVVKYGDWVYWRDVPKFGQRFWEYGFGESKRFWIASFFQRARHCIRADHPYRYL
jgi:hypothetical protein